MATRNMMDKMRELRREAGLRAAGWERIYIRHAIDKDLQGCVCGSLPHMYRTADGRFAVGCTACGSCTDDATTDVDALKLWNKAHKDTVTWTLTNAGVTDPAGRAAWEQIAEDGSIETIYR